MWKVMCQAPFIDSSMNSWISSTLEESIDCANINSCKQTNKQQNKTKSEQLTLPVQLRTLHLVSLSTWRLTPLISLNDDSSSSLLVWNGSLTSDCEESWWYSIHQLMYQPNTITTTNPTNLATIELNYHRLQSGSSCFHNTLAQ